MLIIAFLLTVGLELSIIELNFILSFLISLITYLLSSSFPNTEVKITFAPAAFKCLATMPAPPT